MNNKIKLTFEEPKYNVLPHLGVVVCDCNVRLSCDEKLDNALWNYIKPDSYVKLLNFRARGVARTKGKDVFDEKKGKKIAYTKAQNAAYRKVRNTYIAAMNRIIKMHKILSQNAAELYDVEKHNIFYLKEQ